MGFGVAKDLLELEFSDPEVAPPEYRAVAYNAAPPVRLRSGLSGETTPADKSCCWQAMGGQSIRAKCITRWCRDCDMSARLSPAVTCTP